MKIKSGDRQNQLLERFLNLRYPQDSVAEEKIEIPAAVASPYIASVKQQEAPNFVAADIIFVPFSLYSARFHPKLEFISRKM